ncbi:hypothetical protein DITRI_Ditri07aG0099500 [Diplodiscus trichospermus]
MGKRKDRSYIAIPSCYISGLSTTNIKAHLRPSPSRDCASSSHIDPLLLYIRLQTLAMVALWFKTFILVSLLLIMPFSYGMADGFQGGMQTSTKYSVEQGGMIRMSSSRKLLQVHLDYENPHANPPKHKPPMVRL